MKPESYQAMLDAVEQALAICRQSLPKIDETHGRICDDLRDARDRLRELLRLPPASDAAPRGD